VSEKVRAAAQRENRPFTQTQRGLTIEFTDRGLFRRLRQLRNFQCFVEPISTSDGSLTYAAGAKCQYVNIKIRNSDSHRSGVCAAVRKATENPMCCFSAKW
jgi:hypothetical protein